MGRAHSHTMRLPTQILLLGAILTNGARASETAPAPAAASNDHPPANQQEAPASPVVQLEPVRVTADLWETPLDRIPASVSVYEGAALRTEGVRHFGDLAAQIPNLTATGGTARPRFFQIRGVGENSQFEGESPDAAVRFLVDDLDFTGLGSVGGTFDTRQVEVLRGPQAGAFGANAAGGVVRIVTNDPTPVWTGTVQGSVGTASLREGGLAVGGPLLERAPEKLMVRLALWQHSSDGPLHNAFLGRDTNARDEFLARLKLTFQPNEAWGWHATALYADLDDGYDAFALDNNGRFTFSDQPGEDDQLSRAGSLRGVYTGSPDVRFTTVTTGAWTDAGYAYDADWTFDYSHPDAYRSYLNLVRERRAFSQELRLDSVLQQDALGWIDRWTLGAYYARLDERGRFFGDGALAAGTDYVSDNVALYGQLGHDFSARSRLVFGLRAEHVGQRSRVDGDGNGTIDFRPDFDGTLFGGKLTLERDLTPRHTAFVSAGRSYKSGGVSIDYNINPAVDPLTFENEQLWNYEAGLRGRWFEDRLTGELTAFYLDRHDAQFRGSVGDTDAFRYYTANGDGASVRGLESALTRRLGDTWALYGSLAWMDSDREAFTLPNGATAAARELAATPNYGYTLGLRRRVPRGWFGHLELVGRDGYFESEGTDERRDAYHVVNTSLGWTAGDWSVSLWARNLLDERYAARVFFFGNDPTDGYAPKRYETPAEPRTVGLSAEYRF